MKKFIELTSTVVPIQIENIDTDQIIPARFLKSTIREGFGKNLFKDWRFENDGTLKKDFILNNPKYNGDILVTGKNFGCGSSREHAAWAILDYGFKAIVSSFFADIFKNNALDNGLLPVQVSNFLLKKIFEYVNKNSTTVLNINLKKEIIILDKYEEKFTISKHKKNCLLYGYDDLEFLISIKKEIESFQDRQISF